MTQSVRVQNLALVHFCIMPQNRGQAAYVDTYEVAIFHNSLSCFLFHLGQGDGTKTAFVFWSYLFWYSSQWTRSTLFGQNSVTFPHGKALAGGCPTLTMRIPIKMIKR